MQDRIAAKLHRTKTEQRIALLVFVLVLAGVALYLATGLSVPVLITAALTFVAQFVGWVLVGGLLLWGGRRVYGGFKRQTGAAKAEAEFVAKRREARNKAFEIWQAAHNEANALRRDERSANQDAAQAEDYWLDQQARLEANRPGTTVTEEMVVEAENDFNRLSRLARKAVDEARVQRVEANKAGFVLEDAETALANAAAEFRSGVHDNVPAETPAEVTSEIVEAEVAETEDKVVDLTKARHRAV
jgi:hypothetical protein